MARMDQLVDDIVLLFRERLVQVVEEMGEARSPEAFVKAERDLVQTARELAAQLTGQVLQRVFAWSEDARPRCARWAGRS